MEPQKEPINLSEPTQAIKREPDCRESPPPPKRNTKAEEERPRKSRTPDSPVHTSSTHIKINSRGKWVNVTSANLVKLVLAKQFNKNEDKIRIH